MKSLTQQFSTWGDKLLQHCDVLHDAQSNRIIRPITIQIAPTEACDSQCPFCSVGNRPRGIIPFDEIRSGLRQFKWLGAKSLEITGGGNPLLYRDGDKRINDVITEAHCLGYKIGVITNSENPSSWITKEAAEFVQWLRVSLAKLDEKCMAEDYDLSGFENKVALSYIIHANTSERTVSQIANVVENWPSVKFVRVAPDCTTDDALTIEQRWGDLVKKHDPNGKWFIKDIGGNYHPYQGGCWVGMVRPYWTSTGVYICTSHVLKTRKYEPEWRLCFAHEIESKWADMNKRLKEGNHPYDIDISKCWHCYYYNNNQLLDTVLNRLPDWEFA